VEKRFLISKSKQDFLENDLIDRLIHVEQKISAKDGKIVKYNQTTYFKSLSPEAKKKYQKHLANKNKLETVFMFLLTIPLMGVAIMNLTLTGNVIGESKNLGVLSTSLIFVLILCVGIVVGIYIKKHRSRLISKKTYN